MIRDEIKKSLIENMKNKQELAVSTLRLINATIKDADIAARTQGNMNGIDDAGVLSVLQKMVKQRQDSILAYQKGGRQDLVEKEQKEIDLISLFLPKQMNQDEMQTAIKAVIEKVGASSIKDMGKVMGTLKAEYAGKMDFAAASGMIKQLLG